LSIVDLAGAGLCSVCYWIALSSTAIAGFWTGPDFDFAPMTGWDCLRSGWFEFPLGWLVNPILLVGAILLLFGRRFTACIAAMAAIGLTRIWTWEFSHTYSLKLLREGYDWWLGSMHVLAAGSLCSMFIHCSDTWKRFRSFCASAPSSQPAASLD